MTPPADPTPVALEAPVLVDTAVWTWVRDRRLPALAQWFNHAAKSGMVLVCDLVILELVRVAPNARRAQQIADRLDAFGAVASPRDLTTRARRLQQRLTDVGHHRRVPPADLLIAATAQAAGVALVHYDRDYERIAAVSDLDARWFVTEGTLA